MWLPEAQVEATPEASAAGRRAVLAQYARTDDRGRLAVWFPPREGAGGYLVRRVVVQGPTGSVARLYAGDPDPLTLADMTASGWSDVADYAQPLWVPPYASLVVVWEATDGSDITGAAVARVEVEDVS